MNSQLGHTKREQLQELFDVAYSAGQANVKHRVADELRLLKQGRVLIDALSDEERL